MCEECSVDMPRACSREKFSYILDKLFECQHKPSQPGVGQLTPSNFIAVATATAALCCSIVPPFSSTRILFRFAIGHPEALEFQRKL